MVGRGTVDEQQSALEALGNLRGAGARGVLGGFVDQLIAGTLPAEIELDLAEAVQASGDDALRSRLDQHRATTTAGSPTAAFADALRGGNVVRGRRILVQNAAAGCMRCHSVADDGADVGPALGSIGSTLTRQQILEALVDPSARIAPGYGNGPSAMPPMGTILSKREIRDLVEYLATLR